MKPTGIRSSMDRRILLAAVTVLVGVIAGGSLSLAQGSEDRAIDQAQRAVSQRIASQDGDRDVTVEFGRDARTEFASNTDIRVRGTGTVTRSADATSRPFSYEAVVNTRNGTVSTIRYDWRGNWYSSGRRAVTNRLTGTYRLLRHAIPALRARGGLPELHKTATFGSRSTERLVDVPWRSPS